MQYFHYAIEITGESPANAGLEQTFTREGIVSIEEGQPVWIELEAKAREFEADLLSSNPALRITDQDMQTTELAVLDVIVFHIKHGLIQLMSTSYAIMKLLLLAPMEALKYYRGVRSK